jgi:hypothetical protein
MFAPGITETVGLKQCHVCGAGQLERDRFCRQCGASQSSRIDQSNIITRPVTEAVEQSDYKTRLLSGSETLRQSNSSPLVSIVTQVLSERTIPLSGNPWAMRLVGALVALPLWLMIVLLSPLEAYIAAKAVARQV